MKTQKWHEILFFGETGLTAGLSYFYALHLQQASLSPSVAGYALCLAVLLGVALYLVATVFQLGVFFRYHLLFVLFAIMCGFYTNSLFGYFICVASAIFVPSAMGYLITKRNAKSAVGLPPGRVLALLKKPATPVFLVSVMLVGLFGLIVNDFRHMLTYPLRNEPETLAEDAIQSMLDKNNFFSKKYSWTPWHNETGNFANNYSDNGDGTITDYATGLMWQQSGSDNYMAYKDVPAYVAKINREKLGGHEDWHLPTIEELASLLESETKNKRHIDSVFDQKQLWCWSSDKRTGGGVWFVFFTHGVVYRYNEDSDSYARLVRRWQ